MNIKSLLEKLVKENIEVVLYEGDKRLNPVQSKILLGLYLQQNIKKISFVSPQIVYKGISKQLNGNPKIRDVNQVYFYEMVRSLVDKGLIIKNSKGTKRFLLSVNMDHVSIKPFLVNAAIDFLTIHKEKLKWKKDRLVLGLD